MTIQLFCTCVWHESNSGRQKPTVPILIIDSVCAEQMYILHTSIEQGQPTRPFSPRMCRIRICSLIEMTLSAAPFAEQVCMHTFISVGLTMHKLVSLLVYSAAHDCVSHVLRVW